MKSKKIFNLMKVVNSLAILAVTQSVNSTCTIYFHQPKCPDSARKLISK